jgi:hypothetical protein
MSLYLCPLFIGTVQFTTSVGEPLSGGQIFTYAAGTSTLISTATTSTGAANNPNPIQLDVNGRLTQEIWLTGGQAYKFIVTDSANNQVGPTYDNITGVNDITGIFNPVNVINAINSADTANAASANAARWAYEKGNTAETIANSALTLANQAYSAANSGGVGVYDGGVLVLTAKGLNFQNTAGANIAVTANGTLTNIQITANAAAQNASSNGYTTLPGGIILQWGMFTTSTGGFNTVTFPHPFPNACLSVVASNYSTAGGALIVGSFTSTSFALDLGGGNLQGTYFAVGN